MPTLKVGIYRLSFQGNGGTDLADAVRRIDALAGEDRAAKLIDDPIRAREHIHISDQYCLLDFTRFYPGDYIETGNVAGLEKTVPLGTQGERLRKHTAVLLDPQSNTMYVQEEFASARIGHNIVGKYLTAKGRLKDFWIEIVLHEKNGLERLINKKHRRFKVAVAGIQNAEMLQAQGLGDKVVLDALKAFKSPSAVIEVSLQGGPGTLDNVLEAAAALLGWNSLPQIFGKRKPVKAITVREGDGPDEETIVNLLDDRMCYLEDIELEPGKIPTDADRKRAVTNAFEQHRDELRRRYPVQNDKGQGV
jgi:hypothetical protein